MMNNLTYLCFARRINNQSFVFRVDPCKRAALLCECTRQQFVDNQILDFAALLATWRKALFLLLSLCAFLYFVIDDGGRKYALFDLQRNKPLTAYGMHQRAVINWRHPAGA